MFGTTEKTTKRMILYSVAQRDKDMLLAIIQNHAEHGSRIFSNEWTAYTKLNKAGYDHFTILNKYWFKKEYKGGQFVFLSSAIIFQLQFFSKVFLGLITSPYFRIIPPGIPLTLSSIFNAI